MSLGERAQSITGPLAGTHRAVTLGTHQLRCHLVLAQRKKPQGCKRPSVFLRVMERGRIPSKASSFPQLLEGPLGSPVYPSQVAPTLPPSTATAVPAALGSREAEASGWRELCHWGGDGVGRDRRTRTETGRARTGRGWSEQGRGRQGKSRQSKSREGQTGQGQAGVREQGRVGMREASVPIFWEMGHAMVRQWECGSRDHPAGRDGGSPGEGPRGAPGMQEPLCPTPPAALLFLSCEGVRKPFPSLAARPFGHPKGSPPGTAGTRWGLSGGHNRRTPSEGAPGPRAAATATPSPRSRHRAGRRLQRAISQSRIKIWLGGIAFPRPFNPISQNFLTD